LHVCDVESHQRFWTGQFCGSAGQFSVEPQPLVQGLPASAGNSQTSEDVPNPLVHWSEGSHWTLPAQEAPTVA
jgi:hypothetical protein